MMFAATCLFLFSLGAAETPESGLSPGAFPELVAVPGGIFAMGRRDDGDDAQGPQNELPRHRVSLDAYFIGKYEVTNREFVQVLNWALTQGRLPDSHGGAASISGHVLIDNVNPACGIGYVDKAFIARPYGPHPSEALPVVLVSWHGAVLFCNWLSEMQGRTPCYDPATWERIEPVPNGFRLPTEAEWERAAAWDASGAGTHRIYGFSRDTIEPAWANYREFRNAAGPCPTNFFLGIEPRVSPAGFYDASRSLVLAVSPAGCFDMSGNVWEWCHDRFDAGYYAQSPSANPAGPTSGVRRVERGGGWNSGERYVRTAYRNCDDPDFVHFDLGFRVARNADR